MMCFKPEKALHVEGRSCDCEHILQEERPLEMIDALEAFFA
jgi:hypothetical protein